MNERAIWRPNEIPLEHWEEMSRTDQIRWWNEHHSSASGDSKPHMTEGVDRYNEGSLTMTGWLEFVICNAASDEIEQFVNNCPFDMLTELRGFLEHAPADDDDDRWSQPLFLHMASHFPWVSAVEIARSERREIDRHRRGVKMLRAYFGEPNSSND